MSSLKTLEIGGLDEVKKVGKEFLGNTPNSNTKFLSLETLILEGMEGLEEWCSCFGSGAEVVFPRLQKMEISNCPELVGKLPNQLPLLETLRIRGCPNLRNLECRHPYLRTLVVEDCSETALKTLGDLTSLRSLRLRNIREMICMEDELLRKLGALQELEIERCKELKSLGKSNKEIEGMVGLKKLSIMFCDELEGLVGLGDQGLLCLPSLESLEIHDVDKLVSFGPMRLPSSLKQMEISECKALECLPEGFMMDESSTCELALEKLTISWCPTLTTFPRGRFPDLSINECENLQSMPEFSNTLKKLIIDGCKHLQSLPEFSNSMKDITISDCCNLQNLPRFPASLGSLVIQNLTSLAFESMDIGKSRLISSNMTNVRYQSSSLESSEIGNVEEVGLELEKMFANCSFSLERLVIRSCNLRRLPENITSFRRLQELEINDCGNLRRLPKHMQELNCLRRLTIIECPNLELLVGQDLPRELEYLEIRDCEKVIEGLIAGGLSRLVSLTKLNIDGGSCVLNIKPEAPVFLPKLQSLRMANFGNVASLGAAFQLPSSIEQLFIENCAKLVELPILELSSNLGHLNIHGCPLLQKRCLDRKGEYWPLLSIIPLVAIDPEEVSG